ncbi:TIM barrel protein [Sneathiella sp. P13V-1]|uniref:2-oxo-tetronate isomerase n=1 Tax=Sneathiella sp. P13V-1 TaxID=2697366 RepID=UPI00187BACA9|nr:2-oxo-tetronate isomerase [Sneathiella sp. P13V-1]MBE7636703.1 TIM barrel protein [Sneathiella sp. P13V-1]
MIKLAANLSFLYTEVPFRDRFALAAEDGFDAVEYLFPYEYTASELAELLAAHNLTQALFNLFPGNWDKGERGLASLPDRQSEFQESVFQAISYATALGCKQLHVMAGLNSSQISKEAQTALYVQNLTWAAEHAAQKDITLTIEPINPIDMPGYFLCDFDQAAKIVKDINSPNLRLQFDFYHCHRIYGTVLDRLQEYLPLTTHIQIASPPLRSEPGTGELAYAPLFSHLERQGYDGFIGCEYKPLKDSKSSLKWAAPYLATG